MRCFQKTSRSDKREIFTIVETLEERVFLSVEMVADVNSTSGSSNPSGAVTLNGLSLFVADDGTHGLELWRTDGTAAGTYLLKDIAVGSQSSSPFILGTAGGSAFFQIAGGKVWRTDGTTAGTTAVTDHSSFGVAPTGSIRISAQVGSDLYFAVSNVLYRINSQSSVLTTVMSMPGSATVSEMVSAGTKLYMVASDQNLYVSDGTATGTTVLKSLAGTTIWGSDFGVFGDTVLFPVRKPGTNFTDLWSTQGTADTTFMLKDMPDTSGWSMMRFTSAGPISYFFFADSQGQLWKTDGTATGTVVLKSITASVFTPLPITVSGQRAYFNDGQLNGAKLWTSDGTAAGTVIIGTSVLPNGTLTRPAIDLNGTLLFQGSDTASGAELWRSDGTAATTTRLVDIAGGTTSSSPQFLGVLGSRAIFAATDPTHGRELWTTDGAAAGSSLLIDLNGATGNATPGAPVVVNGHLLFSAVDNGGVAVMQVMPTPNDKPRGLTVGAGGALATNPTNLTASGARAFFTAKAAGGTTLQLYATDGTAAGTSVVRSMSDIPLPENFYATGDGRVFFTGGNAGKSALYISDGTAAGTVALTGNTLNLFAADDNRLRRMFTIFNGSIYFVAQQGSGPWQLWRSDGTASGTSIMTTFTTTGNNLNWLTSVGNRLYFLGLNGALYATDGIATPAVVLADSYTRLEAVGGKLIVHPSSTSNFRLFTFSTGDTALTPLTQADFHFTPIIPSIQVGKWLYFVGATSSTGPGQVWRTDGTTAGTTQLSNGTLATDLTAVGDLVYFTDDDGTSGRELWVTDGTAAGTTRVADIIPGISTSGPANLADWAGTLYFAASDGIHGKELWRDDRTPPSVLSSGFEFADVTVQFTENVGASMALSDWRLTDRATGMDVSNLLQAVSFDSSLEVARLTLVSAMPDGDYRLTLAAGAVADSAGNAMLAETSFDFFQLTGDINRDRSVDFNDLAIMAQNYNTAGNAWATGDLNGDGMTDFLDLALLAQRYNTSLPDLVTASTAASVASVAPASVSVRSLEQKPSVFNTVQPVSRRPIAPRKPVQRKGH